VEDVAEGEGAPGQRVAGDCVCYGGRVTAASGVSCASERKRGKGKEEGQGVQREAREVLIPTPTCPIAVAGRGRRGARQLRADGHGGAGQVEDDVPAGWAGHCCSGPNALGLFHSFFSVIFTCCFPFSFGTKYFL
jgi:hypothetical protein